MKLLAVYGTLKSGFSNHFYLNNSKKLGKFKTTPEFTMFSLGPFPGVIPSGNTSITCEVYEINDENTIKRINRLEGHNGRKNPNNFYDTIDINTPWGMAEMFILNEQYVGNRLVVESGDWK